MLMGLLRALRRSESIAEDILKLERRREYPWGAPTVGTLSDQKTRHSGRKVRVFMA